MTNPVEDDEWVVDVVLRANGHDDRQDDVVAAVRRLLPEARRPAAPTYSFDMHPPDGSVGVSCWVSASSAGRAVDLALDLVRSAAKEVIGEELPVWDLRAVPRSAVLDNEADGSSSSSVLWRRERGDEGRP